MNTHLHSSPLIKRIEDREDSWESQSLSLFPKRSLNPKSKIDGKCVNPLCNSEKHLSRHHLIPKSFIPKGVSDSDIHKKIILCQDCHTLVHRLKNNETLAKYYNTEEGVVKLLIENDHLRKPNHNPVVRCINIYCATTENLTRHHLIPKPFRKGLSYTEKVYLCVDCHKEVHKLATNTELAKFYNTKEAIIELLGSDREFRINRVLNTYENQLQPVMAVA